MGNSGSKMQQIARKTAPGWKTKTSLVYIYIYICILYIYNILQKQTNKQTNKLCSYNASKKLLSAFHNQSLCWDQVLKSSVCVCWWPSSPREFHQIVGMHRNHQIVGYELVHRKLLYYCECLQYLCDINNNIQYSNMRNVSATAFFAARWDSKGPRCFSACTKYQPPSGWRAVASWW